MWNSCASKGVKHPMQNGPNLTPEHDQHDRLLIARYAAGDAYPSERDEAARLVDHCDACAALTDDIKLISAGTASLPQINRSRDFRISAEQADHLKGSWFDRLMRGFAAPGWSVVRPVAAASLAIGIVLVVVGALPLSFGAGSASDGAATHDYGIQSTSNAAASLRVVVLPATAAGLPADAAGGASSQPPGGITAPELNAQSAAPAGSVGAVDSATSAPVPAASAAASVAPATTTTGGKRTPAPPKSATQAPAPAPSHQALAAATAVASPALSATGNQGAFAGAQQMPTDRSWLVLVGMIVAFFALLALGLAYVARHRYSDPLIR